MSNIVGYIGVAPSAARTTAQTFPVPSPSNGYPAFKNAAWRGIKVVIDVTAGTSGFSITPTISGYDKTSGKTWTLLAGAAITGASTVILTVYPALTAVTNVTANDVLPESFEVSMAVADAKSVTYSIGAHLLV